MDGVQDPSNLGAIARSAEALGIAGLLAYNCCDVYNPKALRASMGSLLRLPVTVSQICGRICCCIRQGVPGAWHRAGGYGSQNYGDPLYQVLHLCDR